MIQPQTYLNVADNSGARKLMCIRVLGGGNRRYGGVGDVIIAVVKDAIPNMAVKKSDVVRAVIVRTRKGLRRDSGMSIRFDDNAPLLSIQKAILKALAFLDLSPANCATKTSLKLFP